MKKIILSTTIIGLLFMGLMTSEVAGQIIAKKAISLELAKKIAAAAEVVAAKNNWPVAISIVDDGGNLIYLQKMDDTQIGSIEVSTLKARSAILFKRPTKVFADGVAAGNNAILSLKGAFPHGGGLPLILDGKYVGAIGVSGVTSDEDALCTKAGVEVLTSIK